MRKFLLICVLTLYAMPVLTQDSSVDSESIPAFYYYDNAEKAFVIEAADQTDSRRITPSDHGWNGQYQNWSPSGQWFAWVETALSPDSPSVLISSPILNQPVVEYATASPKGRGNYYLEWADDDSLLIEAHIQRDLTEQDKYGPVVLEDETYEITLVRPPFDYHHANDIVWDGIGAQWSPQGRYISFYRSPLNTDVQSPLTVVRANDYQRLSYSDLYVADTIDWSPTSDYSPVVERGIPSFYSPAKEQLLPFFTGWTPDEKLVYVNAAGTHIIFEDVETSEQEKFPVPYPNITRIDWNRAGTLALVYAPIEAKPGPLGRQTLWLFHRETGVWTKLQDGIEPFQGSAAHDPQSGVQAGHLKNTISSTGI